MDAPENANAEAAKASGIDPETGFATDGEWPINGRLRAEAMARAGVENDPAGIVSPELIVATRDRVASEEAEAAAQDAANTPSMRWSADRLREHAATIPVAIETDANKAAILAAIEAAQAAPQTEA